MKDYKVKIKENDIKKINKKNISHLKKDDAYYSFYTDEQNIKKLIKEIDNIEYYNVISSKVKNILKKHLISLIGFLLIIVLLINQSIAVKEIRFINYNTYDYEVEAYLQDKLKKRGPFYYLNDNLNHINYELRMKFYQYEWISVSKEGAFLEVDIKKLDELDEPKIDDGIPGDYVASRDAIIKLYHVRKGVVLIRESQSVNKGDLLITGNLKYLIDGEEYIRPQGIVIGEVLEYKNVKVIKQNKEVINTGKIEVKNIITLFGHNFNLLPSFAEYQEKEEIVFNLFNFFQIKKKYYYQKQEVDITYNKEEAIEYAKSLIRKEFNPSEYEKINYIELIETIETNEYYYFRFIVKKEENIAQFVPIKINE